MSKHCTTVVFSDKAYNAIVRESYAKHPVETGGILLGHIFPDGIWLVMEVIPPGQKGIHHTAYFEYDQDFVNYLGNSVANQYLEPLQLLGLWHRHPGSMDYFSSTDDGTNAEFAALNPYGVISGLVNIDPDFRLTVYHLDHGSTSSRPAYERVQVEVGDDLIPERLFRLRYVDAEHKLTQSRPAEPGTAAASAPEVPSGTNVPPVSPSGGASKKPGAPRWLTFVLVAVALVGIGFLLGRVTTPAQAATQSAQSTQSTQSTRSSQSSQSSQSPQSPQSTLSHQQDDNENEEDRH